MVGFVVVVLCVKEEIVAYKIVEEGNEEKTKLNFSSSKKSTVFEVVLDNDVGDGIEDKSNIIGICSTGKMSINFFCIFAFVQIFKFHLDMSSCFFVRIRACK